MTNYNIKKGYLLSKTIFVVLILISLFTISVYSQDGQLGCDFEACVTGSPNEQGIPQSWQGDDGIPEPDNTTYWSANTCSEVSQCILGCCVCKNATADNTIALNQFTTDAECTDTCFRSDDFATIRFGFFPGISQEECSSKSSEPEIEDIPPEPTITGTINGSVTDSNTVPLPGVKVQALGVLSKQTLTDEGGKFSFTNMRHGDYIIRASKAWLVTNQKFVTLPPDQFVNLQLQTVPSAIINGSVKGILGSGLVPLASACFSSGRQAQIFGTKFSDVDNDLRPDLICDTCVPGDNSLDKDLDHVPDACDYSSTDPKIGLCFVSGKDCKGTNCCKSEGSCGPGNKGKIINLNLKTDPVWQCKMESETAKVETKTDEKKVEGPTVNEQTATQVKTLDSLIAKIDPKNLQSASTNLKAAKDVVGKINCNIPTIIGDALTSCQSTKKKYYETECTYFENLRDSYKQDKSTKDKVLYVMFQEFLKNQYGSTSLNTAPKCVAEAEKSFDDINSCISSFDVVGEDDKFASVGTCTNKQICERVALYKRTSLNIWLEDDLIKYHCQKSKCSVPC